MKQARMTGKQTKNKVENLKKKGLKSELRT